MTKHFLMPAPVYCRINENLVRWSQRTFNEQYSLDVAQFLQDHYHLLGKCDAYGLALGEHITRRYVLHMDGLSSQDIDQLLSVKSTKDANMVWKVREKAAASIMAMKHKTYPFICKRIGLDYPNHVIEKIKEGELLPEYEEAVIILQNIKKAPHLVKKNWELKANADLWELIKEEV